MWLFRHNASASVSYKFSLYMKQLLVFSISVLSILSGVCQNSVSGVVTSENGNPLVGASIFVKNAYKGSVTNSEGFYQLDLDDGQYSLSVQHLGYKTMISEVIVSGDSQGT